jgi:hypothetical protein
MIGSDEQATRERESRMTTDGFYERVHTDATKAGEAAYASVNAPMFQAVQHADPFDDGSEIVKVWPQAFELEGFGWVQIFGANKGYGKFLSKRGIARKWHPKGVGFSIPGRGYERRLAYADAYATSVREALAARGEEVSIHGEARLD